MTVVRSAANNSKSGGGMKMGIWLKRTNNVNADTTIRIRTGWLRLRVTNRRVKNDRNKNRYTEATGLVSANRSEGVNL